MGFRYEKPETGGFRQPHCFYSIHSHASFCFFFALFRFGFVLFSNASEYPPSDSIVLTPEQIQVRSGRKTAYDFPLSCMYASCIQENPVSFLWHSWKGEINSTLDHDVISQFVYRQSEMAAFMG